ncbi:RimJ/RimL family protein N-acetyltransferase [Allocatelliglobosispora scoriae]|uniref:RimJ/RimL family protein N-acetyltransferase n=1 Tax=Allocatelliglobosispora scoriae TaxID=643052 RepID=A0A841C548_9ACTN|nr:GNAT family protein [Allocatelliglobosispora scoriae]MBB5873941.1 RimJ/RimL family protein N-acetyltransferase [Allocatelliglobosispora scoriae]
MPHPYWPLFDLRLTAGDLMLRPVTEADLVPLARIQPADLETDPGLPALSDDPAQRHAMTVFQSYWERVGGWRPDDWKLPFAVFTGGALVGWQELEARDFAALRTVETSSWLTPSAQGRGLGKRMRIAVLALAFEGLAAQAAQTEAWHDNAASLGVSTAVGYADNGRTRHRRGTGADDMVRLRMTRAQWQARHPDHGVRIDNLPPCRHMFGA